MYRLEFALITLFFCILILIAIWFYYLWCAYNNRMREYLDWSRADTIVTTNIENEVETAV